MSSTDLPTSPARAPLPVRVAVAFFAALGIWALLSSSAALTGETGPSLGQRVLSAVLICALVVPLVWLARRYLDRRDWAGLGVQPVGQAGRPFLIGVVAFAAPSALGLTVAHVTGWVTLAAQIPLPQILGWAVVLIPLVFLSEALPEELIFRGYLQRNLSTVLAPWVAAIAQGGLFALFGTALWVATEGWAVLADRAPMFLGMGIVLGLLRVQTGSVWTPIGFHLAFQVTAQSLLSDRIGTNNEPGLMLAGFVSAFVLATTVVSVLHRAEVNWSRPEPE